MTHSGDRDLSYPPAACEWGYWMQDPPPPSSPAFCMASHYVQPKNNVLYAPASTHTPKYAPSEFHHHHQLSQAAGTCSDTSTPFHPPNHGGWWQQRTKLEKMLLSGSGLLAITWVALTITLVAVLASHKRDRDLYWRNVPPPYYPTPLPPTYHYGPLRRSRGGRHAVCLTEGCKESAAALADAMDTDADPCHNFYQYSCGKWRQRHPIPPHLSSYGTFNMMREALRETLKEVVQVNATRQEPAAIWKTKILYQTCLDSDIDNKMSEKIILEWIDLWGGWPMTTPRWNGVDYNWLNTEAEIGRTMSGVLLAVYVYADPKNTELNTLIVDQMDLGLGREFLLQPDQYKQYVDAYKMYIKAMAQVFSKAHQVSDDDVEELIHFETVLANLTTPPEERRDKERLYNKMTVRGLHKLTNHVIGWQRYLNHLLAGITDINMEDELLVTEPQHLMGLAHLLRSTEPRIIANYITWRCVSSLAWHISTRTRHLQFEFHQVLSGIRTMPKLWKSCVSLTNELLPFATGHLFVQNYFSERRKQIANDMISRIQGSFMSMIRINKWMDSKTISAAIKKAKAMAHFTGYPEWIMNHDHLNAYYEKFSLQPTHLQNVWAISQMERWRELECLTKAFDKKRWLTGPGVINAFYSSTVNGLTIPAAILQPPFFDANRIQALNYGGIGAVIGHEITHGFDDQGRQMDKNGNLRQWWSNGSIEAYKKHTQCLQAQYSSYCPMTDDKGSEVCINGNNTLGENIADNGGLQAAFRAYRRWLGRNGEEGRLPGLERLTANQLFFVGFAHTWCGTYRKPALLNQLLYDEHSPGRYRVIGSVVNSLEFAKAFRCKRGSPMNPVKKCRLW